MPFAVSFFAGQAATRMDSRHAASAPQRDAPPRVLLDAMKWLPRPSFRALAVGALAALAALAALDLARSHNFAS